MSGNKLVLDSNIAIYLSKRTLTISSFSQPGDVLCVSLITYMEVIGYPFTDPLEERFTSQLFNSLALLPITKAIANRVVLYRKVRKIKLPDAIILATARENNCQLITRNVDDFMGIDNQVTINNPFDK